MATEEQILEGDVHVLLLVFVAIHQCDSKAMLQLQHYQRRRRCKQCQVNDEHRRAMHASNGMAPESPVPAVCSSQVPTGKRLPLGKAAKFQRFNSSEVADVPTPKLHTGSSEGRAAFAQSFKNQNHPPFPCALTAHSPSTFTKDIASKRARCSDERESSPS